MDVSVGWVFKHLQSLHLSLGCSEMCIAQTRVPFLSLSGGGRVDLSIYYKGLPTMLERVDQMVCLRGCAKQCDICP